MYKELDLLVTRKYFLSKKHHTVYDYGGRKYFRQLKELGYKVEKGPVDGLKNFNMVLCINELSNVESSVERKFVVQGLWTMVGPGDFIYLTENKDSGIDIVELVKETNERIGFLESGSSDFKYVLASMKNE